MTSVRLRNATAVVVGLVLIVGPAGCAIAAPEQTTPQPEAYVASMKPSAIPTSSIITAEEVNWDTNGDGFLTVAFAQTGSESTWALANTQSFKDYFVEANGFRLFLGDADSDDATQKAQFRGFITQGAEVIVVRPIAVDGWKPVLQEARDAGIPVIDFDRPLTGVSDLCSFFFGYNFRAEGDNVVSWMQNYFTSRGLYGPQVKIIHLQGQMGTDAQVGRSKALALGVLQNGWNVVATQSGDFLRDWGMMAMRSILDNEGPNDFNVVYSENDDMTYGALDAMMNDGLDPKNYTIISFDGNKSAVQLVINGTISVIGQYNPSVAPQLGELIKQASHGKTIASPQYATEAIIDSTNAVVMLPAAFGT